jgi:hypothetical protein
MLVGTVSVLTLYRLIRLLASLQDCLSSWCLQHKAGRAAASSAREWADAEREQAFAVRRRFSSSFSASNDSMHRSFGRPPSSAFSGSSGGMNPSWSLRSIQRRDSDELLSPSFRTIQRRESDEVLCPILNIVKRPDSEEIPPIARRQPGELDTTRSPDEEESASCVVCPPCRGAVIPYGRRKEGVEPFAHVSEEIKDQDRPNLIGHLADIEEHDDYQSSMPHGALHEREALRLRRHQQAMEQAVIRSPSGGPERENCGLQTARKASPSASSARKTSPSASSARKTSPSALSGRSGSWSSQQSNVPAPLSPCDRVMPVPPCSIESPPHTPLGTTPHIGHSGQKGARKSATGGREGHENARRVHCPRASNNFNVSGSARFYAQLVEKKWQQPVVAGKEGRDSQDKRESLYFWQTLKRASSMNDLFSITKSL